MDLIGEVGIVVLAAAVSAFLGARTSVWTERHKAKIDADTRAAERRRDLVRSNLLEVIGAVDVFSGATIRAIDAHRESWQPKKIVAVDRDLQDAVDRARQAADQVAVPFLRVPLVEFIQQFAGIVHAETAEEALQRYEVWVDSWQQVLRPQFAAVMRLLT